MRVLVLHGKGSSPEKVKWLSSALPQRFDVLVPPAEAEIPELVETIISLSPDLVVGHSRGGTASLIASSKLHIPVIAVSSPSDRRAQLEYLSKFPEGTVQHMIYKDVATLPSEVIDLSPVKFAHEIRRVLLIHGEKDEIVLPSQSQRMCELIRESGGDCRLYIIRGMKHSPVNKEIGEVQRIIRDWIDRLEFLGGASAP